MGALEDYVKLICKYSVSTNRVLSTLVLSYNFDDKIHKKYKFQTQILVGIGASSKKSTTITTNFLGWKFFRNKKFILDKINLAKYISTKTCTLNLFIFCWNSFFNFEAPSNLYASLFRIYNEFEDTH